MAVSRTGQFCSAVVGGEGGIKYVILLIYSRLRAEVDGRYTMRATGTGFTRSRQARNMSQGKITLL